MGDNDWLYKSAYGPHKEVGYWSAGYGRRDTFGQ